MEIVIFVCDWCGKKQDSDGLPCSAHGWVSFDPELLLQKGFRESVKAIYLFPEAMRVEKKKPDDKPHFENLICNACVAALQDAVEKAREIQIAKRK